MNKWDNNNRNRMDSCGDRVEGNSKSIEFNHNTNCMSREYQTNFSTNTMAKKVRKVKNKNCVGFGGVSEEYIKI